MTALAALAPGGNPSAAVVYDRDGAVAISRAERRRRAERAVGRRPVSLARLSTRQHEVFSDQHRFRVLIAGRRFGKTTLAIIELLSAAASQRNALCWYLAPTYRMAKDIAWEVLKVLCPPSWVRGRPNESTLTLRLVNGSLIQLKGVEKPDSLRGRKLFFVVPDEVQLMARLKTKLWAEVLAPSLSDSKGRALFIGTPAGFNETYDLFTEARDDMAGRALADGTPASGEWSARQFTTAQGGFVDPAEIARQRRLLDPRSFRQEYGATFEALSGRVYGEFVEAIDSDATLIDDGRPLWVGMDFNVNPMTAVGAIRVRNRMTGRRELHILHAWSLPNSNTPELAAKIRRQFPTRRLIVCPDASGKARHTSSSGETDHTILKRHGFEVEAPEANPRVKDRVNAVNAALCSEGGIRRVRIHPRCAPVVKALNGLTWVKGVPDPKSPHIHITDALGYLVWSGFNLLEDAKRWTETPYRLI